MARRRRNTLYSGLRDSTITSDPFDSPALCVLPHNGGLAAVIEEEEENQPMKTAKAKEKATKATVPGEKLATVGVKRKREEDRMTGRIEILGRSSKRRRRVAPKKAKEEEVGRLLHFIKVFTGFFAGGGTKDDRYKSFMHGELSKHWRKSPNRAFEVMKKLRIQAINRNRLRLFDEMVNESNYNQCHGTVADGYSPLF